MVIVSVPEKHWLMRSLVGGNPQPCIEGCQAARRRCKARSDPWAAYQPTYSQPICAECQHRTTECHPPQQTIQVQTVLCPTLGNQSLARYKRLGETGCQTATGCVQPAIYTAAIDGLPLCIHSPLLPCSGHVNSRPYQLSISLLFHPVLSMWSKIENKMK